MNPNKRNRSLWGMLALCFMCLFMSIVTLNTTGCSAAQQAEFQSTADKLGTDAVAYGETLGNMLITGSKIVATEAPAIESLAQAWGLMPANSQQLAVYNKVIAALPLVSASGTALTTMLNNLQATGTVQVASAYYILPKPQVRFTAYLRPIYGWKDAYNVRLAVK